MGSKKKNKRQRRRLAHNEIAKLKQKISLHEQIIVGLLKQQKSTLKIVTDMLNRGA